MDAGDFLDVGTELVDPRLGAIDAREEGLLRQRRTAVFLLVKGLRVRRWPLCGL